MFARSYQFLVRGRFVDIDFYTPAFHAGKNGIDLHADTVLVLRRKLREWRWVVGVRVLGFGVAIAVSMEPRGNKKQ